MAGTGGCSRGELFVEGRKESVEDEGREQGAEGATLGETFVLEKRGERAVRGAVPDMVGLAVEDVKKGEAKEGSTSSITGNGIEHIGNVEEEEGTGGVLVVGEEGLELGHGGVEGEINTTAQTDAELAGR